MVFIGTSLCSLFVAGGVAPKRVSLEEPFSSSNEPERGPFPAKAGRLKSVDMKKSQRMVEPNRTFGSARGNDHPSAYEPKYNG